MGFFDKVKDTASVVADKAKKAGSDIGMILKLLLKNKNLKAKFARKMLILKSNML